MPAGQTVPNDAASPANGHSLPSDLFALTDEQILDLEPDGAAQVEQPLLAVPEQHAETVHAESAKRPHSIATSPRAIENAQQSAQAGVPVLPEPPEWLAAQMKDPWTGEAARELWNGAQQAKQEAAAYREAFATPEDARALKDLYPGGVNEARAASERARVLDDIDRAFFGAAGKSAQETSASREQLAKMMLREDPAAFREMVFAGLRVLEEAGKGISNENGANQPRLAQVFAANRTDQDVAPVAAPFRAASSSVARQASTQDAGLKPADTNSAVGAQHVAPHLGNTLTGDPHLAAYASFEKAANEDLERSVGGAIERTIAQALPVAQPLLAVSGETQARVPALRNRLSGAVRQDVEAALKGDRQLGEQIAQILSGRRFDNETRAQVVRLIGERAQQLVPAAAKRVLNDWTQATLAAHRGQSSRSDAAAEHRELKPATASPGAPSVKTAASARSTTPRRVDYRKISDEQILDL